MKFENEITVELMLSLKQTQQILFNKGFELKEKYQLNDIYLEITAAM